MKWLVSLRASLREYPSGKLIFSLQGDSLGIAMFAVELGLGNQIADSVEPDKKRVNWIVTLTITTEIIKIEYYEKPLTTKN